MRPAIFFAATFLMVICLPAARADFNSAGGSRLQSGDKVEYFGLKPLIPSDGKPLFVNIGDMIGPEARQPRKALLISFFASWCASCKNELPQIEKYYREYRDKGLASVYICIDKEKEGIDKAREFVRSQGFSAEVLHDVYNIVARRYFTNEFILPATYIIGADGKIKYVFGGGGVRDIAEIEKVLSSLFRSISQPNTETGGKSTADVKE